MKHIIAVLSFLAPALIHADNASLRAKFSKLKIQAVFPDNPTFPKLAAAYNQRFTYVPTVIVLPRDKDEVASTVKIGVIENLPVCARSGGHSYAAYGLCGRDGGLVIDLSKLTALKVDTSTGIADIGTGNKIGDIALALNNQGGRMIPAGLCPTVGIGGHTAFGGFGYISRMLGLTLDNVLGHEVVLANGTIVQTSKDQNRDLFWAMRGAGSSFGIMTSIKFRTHPAPKLATNFLYVWNLNEKDLAEALINYQSFSALDLPANVGMYATLSKGKSDGMTKFKLEGAWYGEVSDFSPVMQQFLKEMRVAEEKNVTTTNWIISLENLAIKIGYKSLSTADADTASRAFYAKSITTPQSQPASESSIRALSHIIATQGWKIVGFWWFVQFELYGGKNSAIMSVPISATAFAQRDILLNIQLYVSKGDGKPPFLDEGFKFNDNMATAIVNNNPPDWPYGAYINYIDDRLKANKWKSLYYKTKLRV